MIPLISSGFVNTQLTSRANQLEDDLRAYFDVLSTYMEEKADFKEFREELEERRMKGITMDGKLWMQKFYQELFWDTLLKRS